MRPDTAADDAARRTAYDVVLAVEQQDAFGNLALRDALRKRQLSARDAAFVTELTSGTLRWQGVLDDVIAAAARRDVASIDPEVRAVLRLGAYQLLHMRVPAHAAVHSSVQLVRSVAGHRVTGFVNAVLRAVGREPWEVWVDRLAPTDDIGKAAFAAGFPRWVATSLHDALGGGLDELRAALAEDRPATHLVARPGRIGRDELLEEVGPTSTAGPWSPYAVRLSGGGDPGRLAAVQSGRAGVQDEGSQLVTLALTRAELDGPEQWWADVCAGPGGKAALLEGLLPAGTRLVAADLQPHRARLVTGSLRSPAASTVIADSTTAVWQPASLSRTLVDAPCTGLGALRRRPEVRWRRRPEDADRLHPLQVHLLTRAVEATRPGGLVAYVTCSPHLRETHDVVDAVATGRSDLRIEDARPLLPGLPDLGPGPHVQLWPHRHGTDAMYLAVMRRLPVATVSAP